MLNPGINNGEDYIFQKSFRIQIKLDVSVKIFMTQRLKKNSAYQWKDQDSFKVMEMMALGYIFHPSFCLFFYKIFSCSEHLCFVMR